MPIAAWRSVDHSQQTFFTESFIDELAHRAGTNPFQFRMELLHNIRDISRFCRSQRKPQGMAETCPKVVPWA